MRRAKVPVLGSYLLEAALVTFGAAFFIVGASDVARVFHGRSAVRAGIREGMRCVYPTDAGCSVAPTENLAPGLTRYNVSVWDEIVNYVIPQSTWSAQAAWTTEPELLTPIDEETLTKATLELSRQEYRRNDVLYPVQGHYPYLIQEREFPLIGGDPLNPEFRDRIFHRVIAANKQIGISSVSRVVRAKMQNAHSGYEGIYRIGTVEFSVRDAWRSRDNDRAAIQGVRSQYGVEVPCYTGELDPAAMFARLKLPPRAPPSLCRYRNGSILFEKDALSVPLMFRVSGSTVGTSAKGQGKVLLALRWERGRESGAQTLGGRLIAPGGSGNFVVRGATLSDIALNARTPYQAGGVYEREVRDNGTLELIPVDARVFLDVFLVSLNGEPVSWRGQSLELFYPSFSFVPEQFSCGYSSNPVQCEGAVPVRPLYTSVDLRRDFLSRPTDSTLCSREPPRSLVSDTRQFLNSLKDRVAGGAQAASDSFWQEDVSGTTRCAPTTKEIPCVGSPHKHLRGCGTCEEVHPAQLPVGCVEPGFTAGRDRVVSVGCLRTSTGEVDMRLGCSGEILPQCAQRYSAIGAQRTWSGSVPGCSLAKQHAPPPLRLGPIPVSKCGAPPIEQAYRARYAVPEGVSISVSSSPDQEKIATEAPQDACIDFREALKKGLEKSCGARLTSAGASQCCANHNGRCIVRPVRINQAAPGRSAGAVLLDKAADRVAATVMAAYPQADRQSSCAADGANCLKITSDALSTQNRVRLRASLTVPLRLSSLFGLHSFEVSHEETRGLEQQFVSD